MTPLTVILPHFCNLGMMAEHFNVWADYPDQLKANLHVIVVDDCSPKGSRPSAKTLRDVGIASFRLYRIGTKVRWNWLACRNLGMAEATTDWALMTDMDHVLPSETMQALSSEPRETACVYRLPRVDAYRPWPYDLASCPVREQKRMHPNTWLMTRAMFDRVGGYDERLSGCYGTDGEFKDRVHASARAVVTLTDVMVRYPREVIADASTLPEVYTRKNDPVNDAELVKRRAARSAVPGWKPLRLTFPWERVA
jgi:glycosyltransferase involved in cell wall biosynthesis